MTSQHKTNTHSFLWQAGKRPALIHFLTSQHNAGTHPFFKTSQHNTGTHPFYIGMYIHICTHIYVHIFTSQKERLHIFSLVPKWATSESSKQTQIFKPSDPTTVRLRSPLHRGVWTHLWLLQRTNKYVLTKNDRENDEDEDFCWGKVD